MRLHEPARRAPAPQPQTTTSGRSTAGEPNVNLEDFPREDSAEPAESQDYTRAVRERTQRPFASL